MNAPLSGPSCCLSVALLLWGAPALAQDLGDPEPFITANGDSVFLQIVSEELLTVAVRLRADTAIGIVSDWWVVADTPLGVFHYDLLKRRWSPGLLLSGRGELIDVPTIPVLEARLLPPGNYTFYFGVEQDPNGRLDISKLDYVSVQVQIDP